MRWTDLTPPEWREQSRWSVETLKATGTVQPYEQEYFRKDGGRTPVLIGAAALGGQREKGVAFVIDLTDRKRAEAEARESQRRYREVQLELEHANRVATIGQLSASIAHEVNQPIAAAVTNTQTALRWLDAEAPKSRPGSAGARSDRRKQQSGRGGYRRDPVTHQERAAPAGSSGDQRNHHGGHRPDPGRGFEERDIRANATERGLAAHTRKYGSNCNKSYST